MNYYNMYNVCNENKYIVGFSSLYFWSLKKATIGIFCQQANDFDFI